MVQEPLAQDGQRDSSTPSAWQLLKRLFHIWPNIDVDAIPQVTGAFLELVTSHYIVQVVVKSACLKPSILWFAVIVVCCSKWAIARHYWFTVRDHEPSFYTYICLVLAVYFLHFLLDSQVRYTSVWCSQQNHQLRTCHFSNLYYDKQRGFLFLLDESSLLSGIHNFEELKNLKLSPIADHKGVNMGILMVRSSDIALFPLSRGEVNFIQDSHFALHRFKPDNLMHVVHDDLIPLFMKFRELSTGNVRRMASTTNLFFVDKNNNGPFSEWYQALSSSTPLLALDLSPGIHCFSSLYVGPSNTSFFQYGFNKYQGPVGPNVLGDDIREFKQYYLDYFGVKLNFDDNVKVTVISRKINRKIVNDDKISTTLSTLVDGDGFFKGKKLTVAKGDVIANMKEMVTHVASSDILVAMHGAETILSLFLPESSVFIEMFPFGISVDNVSPVSSLSKANHVHFRYLSWTNLFENGSILHPEYPKEFGGVEEFPDELKRNVYLMKQVPAVPCCNDPFYLFRMYQDTIIDDSFSKVAAAAVDLLKSKRPTVTVESRWFFPGPVLDLSCIRHPGGVNVSWAAPHNTNLLRNTYDVTVLADSIYQHIVTYQSTLLLNYGESLQIQVWVSSEVNGKKSVDSYCKCGK